MSPQRQKGLRRLAVALTLTGILAVFLVYWLTTRSGDVSNPDVEFNPPAAKRPPRIEPETFVWPMYGLTPARTRSLNADLRPPFRPLWRFNAHKLLEFPPILVRGTLYFVRQDAKVIAIDAKTGHRIWTRQVGDLSAASPAYADGRIFVSTLTGRILALDARTGHKRWARVLGARTESSPLVIGKSVLLGAETGLLYRLSQKTGRVEWTYNAGGKIKGGPAYASGKVFVGTYAGAVHAVRATNGKRVWASSTNGTYLGLGSGNFYGTPTVAYGRVYIGNTDGNIYSFSASSGRLAWSKSTGGYVYSAAAVDDVARLGTTVFIGSYDGRFYALNARTGGVRWSFNSGGPISGAATVIGKIVYFSTLRTTTTFGLDTRTGKKVFKRNFGAYNPAISDGKRLYLTGYESISAYVPRKTYKSQLTDRRRAVRQRR